MAIVGSFWLKEKEYKGEKKIILSGYLDQGVTSVDIIKNKFKEAGDNKPDFVAFSKSNRKPTPRPNSEDSVPF